MVKPLIEGYEKKKEADFHETRNDGQNKYGLCEIEGIRYEFQEDAMATSSDQGVAALPQLTDEQIEASYNSTFEELQTTFGQQQTSGATCCSASAWINEHNEVTTWTANLGDSAAYLVIIKPDGKSETIELNKLHNPGAQDELERLKSISMTDRATRKQISVEEYVQKDLDKGGQGRLPGSLAVSRAFGDQDSENYGLSHKPEIKKQTFKLERGDTAFLIVACDGLTEKALKSADLGPIVAENHEKSQDKIAEALVNAAYNKGTKTKGADGTVDYSGSTDNISCGIFQIGRNPGSITVLDGHGAIDVDSKTNQKYSPAAKLSKDIATNFYSTLQKYIAINATKKTSPIRTGILAGGATGILVGAALGVVIGLSIIAPPLGLGLAGFIGVAAGITLAASALVGWIAKKLQAKSNERAGKQPPGGSSAAPASRLTSTANTTTSSDVSVALGALSKPPTASSESHPPAGPTEATTETSVDLEHTENDKKGTVADPTQQTIVEAAEAKPPAEEEQRQDSPPGP